VEAALSAYLGTVFAGPVEILGLRSLGGPDAEGRDPKGFGYGVPFEVECVVNGSGRNLVVARTRPVQGFGHDYPEDRAWQALYSHRAYNSFPAHVRSLDVGFIRESGTLVSASFVDYLVPTAADLISFDTGHTTSPATNHALGAKGVGEAGAIASTPAVVNAVVDALRPFGVTDVRMPCTPERIWKAIHDQGGGGTAPTEGDAMPHFDEKDVADRTDGASA